MVGKEGVVLEMKLACERCGKMLSPDTTDARICSYECTFCSTCSNILSDRCPNCGGVLCGRPPRRPKSAQPLAASAAAGAGGSDAPSEFPTAAAYSAEGAQFPSLTVVDLLARQSAVTERYRNEVIANVDDACLRLAVFDQEYHWHLHADSDELFLVVAGTLEIDLEDRTVQLAPWQMIVIPAGTVHRTRAIGRTVNVTFEKQGASTVFLASPQEAHRPGEHAAAPDPTG